MKLKELSLSVLILFSIATSCNTNVAENTNNKVSSDIVKKGKTLFVPDPEIVKKINDFKKFNVKGDSGCMGYCQSIKGTAGTENCNCYCFVVFSTDPVCGSSSQAVDTSSSTPTPPNNGLDLSVSPTVFSTVLENKSLVFNVTADSNELWNISFSQPTSWFGNGTGIDSFSLLTTKLQSTPDGNYYFTLGSALKRNTIRKDVLVDNTKPKIGTYSLYKEGSINKFKINVTDPTVNGVKSGINLDTISFDLKIPNMVVSNIQKNLVGDESYDITADIQLPDGSNPASTSSITSSFDQKGRLKVSVSDKAENSEELLISNICETLDLSVSTDNNLDVFSAKAGRNATIDIKAPKCDWNISISNGDNSYSLSGAGSTPIYWNGYGDQGIFYDGTYDILATTKKDDGTEIKQTASVKIDNTPPKLVLDTSKYTISDNDITLYLTLKDISVNGVLSGVDITNLPLRNFYSADSLVLNISKDPSNLTDEPTLIVKIPKGFSVEATKDEIEKALIMENAAITKLKLLQDKVVIQDLSGNKISDFNCK